MSDVAVVGLGNPLAGDDAVGLLAARRLRGVAGLPAEVVEAPLAGLQVLDLIRGRRAAILIDAVRGGAPAGSIHRLDASSGPLAAAPFRGSTHAVTAADALELGRALGWLPPRVIVFGVEIAAVTAGTPLSAAVAGALDPLVERIVREVAILHA